MSKRPYRTRTAQVSVIPPLLLADGTDSRAHSLTFKQTSATTTFHTVSGPFLSL